MNGLSGYVKLHRQLVSWGWYKDLVIKAVFLHCIIRANFQDQPYRGMIIKKGQFVTSYENFASEVGCTVQKLRTALKKLNSTGEITYKSTSKFTVITVVNWEKYQNDPKKSTHKSTRNLTNEQQTTNKQLTNEQQQYKNDKNIKNDKNEKNIFIGDKPPTKTTSFSPPAVDEVKAYCLERQNGIDAEHFVDYYTANGWQVGKTKMKDWKAAVRTWEKNSSNNQTAHESKTDTPILTQTETPNPKQKFQYGGLVVE